MKCLFRYHNSRSSELIKLKTVLSEKSRVYCSILSSKRQAIRRTIGFNQERKNKYLITIADANHIGIEIVMREERRELRVRGSIKEEF